MHDLRDAVDQQHQRSSPTAARPRRACRASSCTNWPNRDVLQGISADVEKDAVHQLTFETCAYGYARVEGGARTCRVSRPFVPSEPARRSASPTALRVDNGLEPLTQMSADLILASVARFCQRIF